MKITPETLRGLQQNAANLRQKTLKESGFLRHLPCHVTEDRLSTQFPGEKAFDRGEVTLFDPSPRTAVRYNGVTFVCVWSPKVGAYELLPEILIDPVEIEA